MTKEERTIYDMVCRRYLAQFLGSYQYLKTTILVVCEGDRFKSTGKTPIVMGWRALEPECVAKSGTGEGEDEGESTSLPAVVQGETALNLKCELATRKTSPPKRYTEGTLLVAMESMRTGHRTSPAYPTGFSEPGLPMTMDGRRYLHTHRACATGCPDRPCTRASLACRDALRSEFQSAAVSGVLFRVLEQTILRPASIQSKSSRTSLGGMAAFP